MRTRVLIVVGLVLCLSAVADAQQVESTHIFPGAARLAGQPPSQWVSDVTVNNLQSEEIVVGFLYLPERTEHGIFDLAIPSDQRFTLGPRETRRFQDVLRTVFDVDDDKGMVLVTCEREMLQLPPVDDDPYIVASMRTYDVSSPQGTYGQSIPSNNFILNTSGQPSFITGAVNDSDFRTNLGLVNVSLESVTIHYRIFSATAIIAEGSRTLRSLENKQFSFNQLGVGNVEGALTVDLWLDPDDVRDPCLDFFEGGTSFAAYASKVDSRTQDAEFFWASSGWVAEVECDW
jgi:hypothetical protein